MKSTLIPPINANSTSTRNSKRKANDEESFEAEFNSFKPAGKRVEGSSKNPRGPRVSISEKVKVIFQLWIVWESSPVAPYGIRSKIEPTTLSSYKGAVKKFLNEPEFSAKKAIVRNNPDNEAINTNTVRPSVKVILNQITGESVKAYINARLSTAHKNKLGAAKKTAGNRLYGVGRFLKLIV